MSVNEEKQEAKTTKAQKVFEPQYTVEELVSAAKSEFDTTSIVVRAALEKAGKKSYTIREAKQLIERMKKKEVRA